MSTTITAQMVKELRDATGVSVMQCRVALEEAEGDKEKALIILKKKSSSIAMKKSDRIASDGVIVAVEGNGKVILLTLHSTSQIVLRKWRLKEALMR
jgi:elongation factor Ts